MKRSGGETDDTAGCPRCKVYVALGKPGSVLPASARLWQRVRCHIQSCSSSVAPARAQHGVAAPGSESGERDRAGEGCRGRGLQRERADRERTERERAADGESGQSGRGGLRRERADRAGEEGCRGRERTERARAAEGESGPWVRGAGARCPSHGLHAFSSLPSRLGPVSSSAQLT